MIFNIVPGAPPKTSIHTWNKYSVATATEIEFLEHDSIEVVKDTVSLGNGAVLSVWGIDKDTYKSISVSATGTVTLQNRTYGESTLYAGYGAEHYGKGLGGEGYFKVRENVYAYAYEHCPDGCCDNWEEIYEDCGEAEIQYIALPGQMYKDTLIETISSTDSTAYPSNGIHTDGYWYVKQ